MQFVIADTFSKSLAKLENQEQALVKQSAFDFQMNPANPGHQFHRLDRAIDDDFWSFRVNRDVRIIVHRTSESFALCYVDHHDPAYDWAERRKLSIHPETGAVQLVEVVERTEEILRSIVREEEVSLPFQRFEPGYLQALGVPPEWVEAIRATTEEQFLELVPRLPEEAAERLLDLAAGEVVPVPEEVAADSPFEHPDAQRRFRVIDRQNELRQALESPWEEWIVFLHPTQRRVVEDDYSGPARVSGSAGTGKSVVALHRAGHLARNNPAAQVLLTTYSKTLAARLGQNADLLLGPDSAERGRIEIAHLHKLAREIWIEHSSRPFRPAQARQIDEALAAARDASGETPFSLEFLCAEWDAVIDPWGITSWSQYRKTPRTGRGTPMGARQRRAAWKIFQRTWSALEKEGLITWNQLCWEAAQQLQELEETPFDHVIADETQDFGPAEMALLRALVAEGPNDLFLCGDPGQRIYKSAFSWRSLGIDIRGRSTRLEVNYRTTEEIRLFADRLMPSELVSEDGDTESRRTRSLLHGLTPEILSCDSTTAEIESLAEKIEELRETGFGPRNIALFARSERLMKERILPALELCDLEGHRLRDEAPPSETAICYGTMHRAKGLEFKAVIVCGCDSAALPLSKVLRRLTDPADREAFLDKERHLLYVACTRARERLIVSYAGEPSPFLLADAPGGTGAAAGRTTAAGGATGLVSEPRPRDSSGPENGGPAKAPNVLTDPAGSWLYLAGPARANQRETLKFALKHNVLYRPAKNTKGAFIANVKNLEVGNWILLAYRGTEPLTAKVRGRIAAAGDPVPETRVIDRIKGDLAEKMERRGYPPLEGGVQEVIRLEQVESCGIRLEGDYGGQNAIHRLEPVDLAALAEDPRERSAK